MHTDRILFVVTSATRMGNSAKPTGSWFQEIAAPYYAFTDARCDVTLASPLGGAAPLDTTSLEEKHRSAATRRFDADAKATAALAATVKLSTINAADYDAVFFAGGHGTMADFTSDVSVKSMVENFYATGKPLSAVCHGPACFVNATKKNGEPLIKGHRFTCFTDEEEIRAGFANSVPFLLESRLILQGGTAINELPYQNNVVVDRHLITGQNPASAIPVAEAVIARLRSVQQRYAA